MHFDECKENGFLLEKNDHDKKKILTVFFKPFFRDETPVADHSHAGQLKILFAKLYQFPQIRSSLHDKGFTPGKINLLHTCQLSDLYIKQDRLIKILKIRYTYI